MKINDIQCHACSAFYLFRSTRAAQMSSSLLEFYVQIVFQMHFVKQLSKDYKFQVRENELTVRLSHCL
jgi:hypothetical protein